MMNSSDSSRMKCPSCYSTDIEDAGRRRDGATVARCRECGLGFLNPMPSDRHIESMYDSYFSRLDGIGYANYSVSPFPRALDYLIGDIVKRHAKPRSTLLDVGCAFGTRVDFFSRKGFASSGVDFSEDAVQYGREHLGLDLSRSSYESFDPGTRYDVILMVDFIEHLKNPRDWVQKTRDISNEGALLVILTPNFDCYMEYGEDWTGYNKSYEHLLFYNLKSLTTLLDNSGFQVVASACVNMTGPTKETESTGARSRTIRKVLNCLITQFPPIQWWIDLGVSVKHGLTWNTLVSRDVLHNSLLVVAKKT